MNFEARGGVSIEVRHFRFDPSFLQCKDRRSLEGRGIVSERSNLKFRIRADAEHGVISEENFCGRLRSGLNDVLDKDLLSESGCTGGFSLGDDRNTSLDRDRIPNRGREAVSV